jgi:uncharacterized protein (DUF2126 family)
LHPNEVELYKIDQDYNEWNNLADHPEYRERMKKMLAKLQEITGDRDAVVKRLAQLNN